MVVVEVGRGEVKLFLNYSEPGFLIGWTGYKGKKLRKAPGTLAQKTRRRTLPCTETGRTGK